ncbi:DUF5337 domain-containing protein [Yoonia sp. BS5-3]|uniref:DUF5337 domain-containing protein n=1 Tax=Yoonia phaeophyticola TaxID=3137369 RepID=A0ABZ2V7U9_9RHOB
MTQHGHTDQGKAGQRAALIIAGTGALWVLLGLIGEEYGWSNRVRLLIDLAALCGFGFGLWRIFRLWRQRQDEKGGT